MSRHRIPHGAYTRETMDWFAQRRMGGGAIRTPSTGQYASVSLYNDAADGSVLHIYAAQAMTTSSGAVCGCFLLTSALGAEVPGAAVPMTPFYATRGGKIYTNSQLTSLTTGAIWLLGQTNQATAWPHEYPICIIAPGSSLVLQSNTGDDKMLGYFQWISMGSEQGYY